MFEHEGFNPTIATHIHSQNLDGLVVVHGGVPEILRQFEIFGRIPIISIGASSHDFPGLLVDNAHGIREMITHLVEVHECRRIAFIKGPEKTHEDAVIRYRAYCDTLREFGLPVDPNLIMEGDFEHSSGRQAVRVLLDERQAACDAIVAANDGMAFGAIEELEAHGLRVPYDMRVVGFDDAIEASISTPPLTTVQQPMRLIGDRAVEMILSYIRGEAELRDMIVPAKLLIRESCGCFSAGVRIAATGWRGTSQTTASEQQEIFSDMLRAQLTATVRASLSHIKQNIPADLLQLVTDRFLEELQHRVPGTFLASLDLLAREMFRQHIPVEELEPLLSALRRQTQPYLSSTLDHLASSEDIWHQGRVFIEETTLRQHLRQQVRKADQDEVLSRIGAELITTFDIHRVLDIIANDVQRVDIHTAYLVLFEDATPLEEWAWLYLASINDTRQTIETGGLRFPTREILPAAYWPVHQRYTLVVSPLYFQEHWSGYVLLGVGPHEAPIYENLRGQLSSALEGDMLVRQVQKDSRALSSAYEEIETLNAQLKHENRRMRTEMELARQIQTSLLPSHIRDIHPDLEIAAVMLTAEDVGGDYYDIALDREGTLWMGIGDVSGHGVTPGLIMMIAQTIHTSIITNYQVSPKDLVNMINRVVYKNVHERLNAIHFMTFMTFRYEGQGHFQYAGAHNTPLVYRKRSRSCRLVPTQGIWLNLLEDISHVTQGNFDEETGFQAVQELLDERQILCDVIVAANDKMACGAINALEARGLRIPYDLPVVGFDDIVKASTLTSPLTTVRQPMLMLGFRAVEAVLAQIRGEAVSQNLIVPAQLVIRQSCGCFSSAVRGAATGWRKPAQTGSPDTQTGENELSDQIREQIADALRTSLGHLTQSIPVDVFRLVTDRFFDELHHRIPGIFLASFDLLLQDMFRQRLPVGELEYVLSTLRRQSQPILASRPELLASAEDIWHQGRVLIAESASRQHLRQQVQQDAQNHALSHIGSELITTFDLTRVLDMLVADLPQVGIHTAYLVLFEDGTPSEEWAWLRLAYSEGRRDPIGADGLRFQTQEILPEAYWPVEQRYTLIVSPLYFKEEWLGYILLGSRLHHATMYENLRGQISSALKGDLLVQQVHRDSARLTAAYQEISVLNEQLKDDNLRMRTEMELAKQIQTSLLPSHIRDIHPDLEIAAVMIPADEVGGDYYDVALDQDGELWLGIGDVSGHGVTPGLIMMMAQTVHTTITTNYQASPREIVAMINRVLYKNVQGRLGENHFMTFTTLQYQGDGRFQYAGAHLDLIAYRRRTKQCELIDTPGTWLNFLPDIAYCLDNSELALEVGDVLVLYTDGLTEAFTPETHDMLDIHGFLEIITRHGEEEIETLRDNILNDVLDWCGHQRDDDMSLVVVRRVR